VAFGIYRGNDGKVPLTTSYGLWNDWHGFGGIHECTLDVFFLVRKQKGKSYEIAPPKCGLMIDEATGQGVYDERHFYGFLITVVYRTRAS